MNTKILLANLCILLSLRRLISLRSLKDIKKKLLGGYEIYTHNGKKSTGINPIKFAKELEQLGAGEIIINSIDQDGVMKGYDMNLIDKIAETIKKKQKKNKIIFLFTFLYYRVILVL